MFKLWRDERAFIVSAELLLIATVLVVGMVVGLASVRDQIVQEFGDFAAAIGNLNQSYSFAGIRSCFAWTAGSAFFDRRDFCDCPDDRCGGWPGEACVNVFVPATNEGAVGPMNPCPIVPADGVCDECRDRGAVGPVNLSPIVPHPVPTL